MCQSRCSKRLDYIRVVINESSNTFACLTISTICMCMFCEHGVKSMHLGGQILGGKHKLTNLIKILIMFLVVTVQSITVQSTRGEHF